MDWQCLVAEVGSRLTDEQWNALRYDYLDPGLKFWIKDLPDHYVVVHLTEGELSIWFGGAFSHTVPARGLDTPMRIRYALESFLSFRTRASSLEQEFFDRMGV